MNRGVRVLLGVLVLFAATTNAWAQATAQINGTVADSSGGVLPGVTVVAIQTETGFRREAVTDEAGSYSLLNLPIGPYRLEATLAGFRTYAQTGIVLQVNSNPVIPVDAAARQPRGDGVGRGLGAARRDAQPCDRRGHRQRGGRSAAARRPQSRLMLIALAGAAADTGAPSSRSMTDSRGICDRGRPAVRRRVPARRRDAQQRAATASTCRCRFPTRCRSSAWRPARRTRQNGLQGGGTVSARDQGRHESSTTATSSSSSATTISTRPARLPP